MKYYLVLPFVVAIIKNSKGEILLGQTPDLKRKPYPKWWDLPGGKLEEHETPEEGIKRELKEELGVKVISLKLVGVFHHSSKRVLKACTSDIQGVGICYEAKIQGKIVPTEQDNVHFVGKSELKKLKLVPWVRHFLKCYNPHILD